MTKDKTDKWLDVLGGKGVAADPQTRQAAELRNFFAMQEQQTAPLDEATQRRIMNALEAKGVFAQPAATKGLFARAQEWFLPKGRVSGGRFAGLAAIAAALAAILPVMLQPTIVAIKGDPVVAGAPTAVIDSANPDQLAAQLVATLARHGVVATLRSDGADRWVQAQVGADHLVAVQAELVSMGLAAAPTGQLVVQFRRQP